MFALHHRWQLPALIDIESARGAAALKDGATLGAEADTEVLPSTIASGAVWRREEFMNAAHAGLKARSDAAAATVALAVGACIRHIATAMFASATSAGVNDVYVDGPADGAGRARARRGARMSTTASPAAAGGGAFVIWRMASLICLLGMRLLSARG